MANQEVQTWEEIEEDRLIGGIGRRIVTGKKVMLGRLTFPKGAIVPAHSHPNEQITFVLSGSLKFIIDKKKEINVRSGQTIVVPENAEHMVQTHIFGNFPNSYQFKITLGLSGLIEPKS